MRIVRDVEDLLARSQQAFAAEAAGEEAERKLPSKLREDWAAAVNRLQAAQDGIAPVESERTREQQATAAALDEAEDLIRDAKRRLRGLLGGPELDAVLTAYQLDAPLTNLTRDFVVPRLRTLATTSASQTNADAKLPDAVLQRAGALLSEIEAHRPSAQAGLADRKTAVANRNAILDEVNLLRRRAYFHLCAVLPDMDDDPRLDAYGFGGERTRRAPKAEAVPATG